MNEQKRAGIYIAGRRRAEPLTEPLTEPRTEPRTEPLKKIIMLIQQEKMNRKKIMEKLKLSRATVTRYLSELKEKGIIEFKGADKTGHYIIKKRGKTK